MDGVIGSATADTNVDLEGPDEYAETRWKEGYALGTGFVEL